MQKKICCITFIILLLIGGVICAEDKKISESTAEIYKKGKRAVFMKEWNEAAGLLKKLKKEFPQNIYSDSTLYWLAYSQNKLSQDAKNAQQRQDLKKSAIENLNNLIKTFKKSDWVDDARILRIEISMSLVKLGEKSFKKYIMEELKNGEKTEPDIKALAKEALQQLEKDSVIKSEDPAKLFLFEEFLLLAIEDESGKLIPRPMVTYMGLAGTILFELNQRGKISLDDNKVTLQDSIPTGDFILDQVLDLITKSKKKKAIKYWAKKIGKRAKIYKRIILYRLIDKGILTMKTEKIFIFFKMYFFPTINRAPENEVRKKLYEVVLEKKEPNPKSCVLISLISACHLRKAVFKENYKAAKERISEISKKSKIGIAVKKAIKKVKDEETFRAIFLSIIGTT